MCKGVTAALAVAPYFLTSKLNYLAVSLDHDRIAVSDARSRLQRIDYTRTPGELLRLQPIQHPRERDRFADVLDAAHPCGAAFDAHSETGVRHTAVASQV